MKSDGIKKIKQVINKYNKFLITSHVNPDGDSIGSVLACKLFLDQLGKESKIVIPDTIPDSFSFLAGSEEIKVFSPDLKVEFDLALIIDCGDFERVGEVRELIKKEPIINIDHHPDNTDFGDYNLVEPRAAAGEIIYQLINSFSEIKINKKIATALAAAIITDTGSFSYSSTSQQTHLIMADLLEYDVDASRINREVFGTNSYEALSLRGEALRNLEVDESGKVAWITITQQMLKEVNAAIEDTEGIVGYPRSLEGVEVGVLFREQDEGEVKVSLRSNSYFPVNEVAHEFGGGGHTRAAGCNLTGEVESVKQRVIAVIKERMGEQFKS